MKDKGSQMSDVKWITGSERTRKCEGFGQWGLFWTIRACAPNHLMELDHNPKRFYRI